MKELIQTEIDLKYFYRELKEQLAFDNFQDFIDYVMRTGILQLQEGLAA